MERGSTAESYIYVDVDYFGQPPSAKKLQFYGHVNLWISFYAPFEAYCFACVSLSDLTFGTCGLLHENCC